MVDTSLTLVALASQACRQALRSRLENLGYHVDVSPDGAGAPHPAAPGANIAVLLFGERATSDRREQVLSALADRVAEPRLGLFMGDLDYWDREIVLSCNDYTTWPCAERELELRLQRLGAARHGAARREAESRTDAVNDLMQLNLIGESPSFLRAIGLLKRFTHCDAPLLIEGETGTGKDLAARAVHYLSARHDHPFIPVNCGALPDSLLENELFGHRRGAFTDARTSEPGLIARAENGTLFLDEIESLSPRGQVALLRFLQEMEYRPLGSTQTVHANVRVIAATNVHLEQLCSNGTFRQDLIYRLNVMTVRMPPLRERPDDVVLLAEHFLARLRQRYGQPHRWLHPTFLAWLRGHPWPGNIRELENLMHRQFLVDDAPAIGLDAPGDADVASEHGAVLGGFSEAKAKMIEDFERSYLSHLMAQTGGNVTLAAKRARKERRSLGKLLKKHGIDKQHFP